MLKRACSRCGANSTPALLGDSAAGHNERRGGGQTQAAGKEDCEFHCSVAVTITRERVERTAQHSAVTVSGRCVAGQSVRGHRRMNGSAKGPLRRVRNYVTVVSDLCVRSPAAPPCPSLFDISRAVCSSSLLNTCASLITERLRGAKMSEPPASPVDVEGGDDEGGNAGDKVDPDYKGGALDDATAGYEPMDDIGEILGAGEASYDETMQQQPGVAGGDAGHGQYQADEDMRTQPDVAVYGSSSRDLPEPRQRQQQLGDFGEQSYDEMEPQGGVGQQEEDDDEYEDPEEMIREFGRHPMMDRVQEALYNQLLQTYERVSEELRDKDSDVKK